MVWSPATSTATSTASPINWSFLVAGAGQAASRGMGGQGHRVPATPAQPYGLFVCLPFDCLFIRTATTSQATVGWGRGRPGSTPVLWPGQIKKCMKTA